MCSLSTLLQISSIFGKLSLSHNVIFSILEQKPDSKLLDVQCIDKYMYTYFCNHFMQFLETKPEFFVQYTQQPLLRSKVIQVHKK